MRLKTLEIQIAETDTLGFRPLTIHEENSQYLVGVKGNGSYLCISETGLQAVRLLGQGLSIGTVTRHLKKITGTADLTLIPLLEKLLAAGMVQRVGTHKLAEQSKHGTTFTPDIRREDIYWLFSWPAIVGYVVLLGAAVGLLFLDPRCLLTPVQLIASAKYSILASFGMVIGLINAAKHEVAHGLAASYLNVPVRFSVGHRFIFPALQTDMTDLWMVSPNKRYMALAAGMVSDLLTLAIIIIWAFLAHRLGEMHLLPPPSMQSLSLLSLAFIVVGASIIWQFNIFVRTDIYYIVANAMNCRNLHAEATAYLGGLVTKVSKMTFARDNFSRRLPSLKVRAYAFVVLIGYALTSLFALIYVFVMFRMIYLPAGAWERNTLSRFDLTDKVILAMALLFTILWVAYSKFSEMRRDRTVYQVRWLGGS